MTRSRRICVRRTDTKENEHFWLGVTLSNDPAPDNLFVVASYAINPDGKIGSTASQVIDPAVREDLADVRDAIRSACTLLAGALELSLDQD